MRPHLRVGVAPRRIGSCEGFARAPSQTRLFKSRKAAASAQRVLECLEECCGSALTALCATTACKLNHQRPGVMALVSAVLHAPARSGFVDQSKQSAQAHAPLVLDAPTGGLLHRARPTRTLASNKI